MNIKKREAEFVFRKLGIQPKNSGGHVRGFVTIDGKKALPVHYSHGRGDMPGNVGHKFRKSFGLSVSEMRELIDCSLSRPQYEALIRAQLDDASGLDR